MPNHVHLLFTPITNPVAILQSLKGGSAPAANKILNRTGQPFWQQESYDHLVRDASQSATITNYIPQNPVRAGLAGSAETYLWSSARV